MSRHLLTKTICIAALVTSCLFVIPPVYGQQGDTQVPVPSLDVLILVDESETMWNHTDPEGKRVQAVNLFIDQLSASTQVGVRHRAGIIAFGTEPKVIPWNFLDSKDAADRIKQEYQAVHDAFGRSGYGDVNKALAKALEIMKEGHDSSRKPALILISDGQPTRPSPPVNERQGWDVVYAYLLETQRLMDEFKAVSYSGDLCPADSGTPLYTLAVGTDVLLQTGRSTPEFVELYKRFWQSITTSTSGYYETVAPLDEVGSAVTEVFGRLLCVMVYSRETEVEHVREFQFIVEEEHFQISLTISGEDSLAIKSNVFRPGQENPVQPDGETIIWRSGTDYELWGIKRSQPWAGTWRVVLEGAGNVYFSYMFFFPFLIEVQQPSRGAVLPVGKPMEIRARVVPKSERPVVMPVQDFKISITKPDSSEKQLSLEERDGIYQGWFDDTDQSGEYRLAFNATLQNGTKIYEITRVELVPEPWLECVEPAKNSNWEFNVPISPKARVHLAGGVFPQNVKVKAELFRDGEVAEEVPMDCKETEESNVLTCDGQFQAGHTPGAYTVNMVLESILPPGIPVHDRSTVNIVILPPPASTPTPSPVPPTPIASKTPTAIPTPSPPSTPTDTPPSLPTVTPAATPALLETVAKTALSNPFPSSLGVLALALFLLVLYMVRKWKQQPPDEAEGGKQEVEKEPPVLQELRAFIAFFTSLWGILAGISMLFPLSNALTKIIPLGSLAQGSGGLAHFPPLLVRVVTMDTALFIILWTFSQRRQLRRRTRKLQQQALYFFAFGLLALMIYLVANFFVVAGYYERVLGWGGDSPLRLLGDVVLMLSYITFFALITRAFVLLGLPQDAIERKVNPYISGGPVREPDMFFGREKLLKRIMNTLHNNSIMIHGPRRIGKTSLLYQLADRLRARSDPDYAFIPALMDLEGTAQEEFFHTLMEEILEDCQPYLAERLPLVYNEKGEQAYTHRDFARDLRTLIGYLQQNSDKEVRLILLLDEVDVMNRYDQLVQLQLRRIFMKTFARNLGAVVAGVHISKEWDRLESPWYNMFLEMELPPLSLEETIRLIKEPVKGVYSYENEAVEAIWEYSQGHPQLVQQLCLGAINRLLQEKRSRVTKADVESEYREIVAWERAQEEQKKRERSHPPVKQVAEEGPAYEAKEGADV